MTKRRFRAPGYSVRTKGHSVLSRGSYGFTPRRYAGDTAFVPEYVPRRLYDSSAEEYALDSAVTHASSFSDSALYDTYDTLNRSRGRDQQLLQATTAAIRRSGQVSSEPHSSSPRASAAVRRVTRRPAAAPPAKPPPSYWTEVDRYPTSHPPTPVYYRRPRSSYYSPRSVIVLGVDTPWQKYCDTPWRNYYDTTPWRNYYDTPWENYYDTPWKNYQALSYGVPRARVPQYYWPRATRVPEEPVAYPVAHRRRAVISSPAKSYTRPKRAQAPPRYRLRYGYYSHRTPRRAKAAIVASKVEVEPRKKRPRSKFAAEKLRATSRGTVEKKKVYRHGIPMSEMRTFSVAQVQTHQPDYFKPTKYYTPPSQIESSSKLAKRFRRAQLKRARLEEVAQPGYTAGLHASRPPLRSRAGPVPSDRRAIRDVEGFTKPRNLLSWQYRLESRMDPTDIIYKPGSFSRMRSQVRDAHDKLDRHRQLLDRYLPDSNVPTDVQGSVMRKMEELERRDPGRRSTFRRKY